MMRVIVRGARLADVEGFAEQLGKRLLKLKDATRARFRVMGPAPAPIARIKNRFRYHLLVLAQDDRTLQDAAASIGDVDVPKEVQWIVDIDPVDLQ
jgi:primosomal protein N' (replication factor Y)